MGLPKRLGFELSRTAVDGHPRRSARFACARCDATLDVPIKNGNTLSPDHVAKIAVRDHGWQADAETAGVTRCPACLGRTRTHDLVTEAVQPPEEVTMPAEKVTPFKPAAVPALPAPLTVEQRVQIRSYLDKHFDDAVGYYLDGMSDQRIAELLDVPRVHIEQVREAAYGPIRPNPAIAKLQADIAVLKRELNEQQARLAQLQERAGALETELPKLLAAS